MRATSIPVLLVTLAAAASAGAVTACGGAESPPKAATADGANVATTAAPGPAASGATSAPIAPAGSASATPATESSDAGAPSAPPASLALADDPHPKKIAARHVLIQFMGCQSVSPSVVRTRDQAHAVAVQVLRRAKGGEDFARLVVEFSDEPNAGARGGSLGRFGHGAMVREFEDAAFALKPGQISDIVESPFGFHIIQRTE
jgi:NIMA-interacting peptidyl-prolyl cis-trans isomerase 1